MNAWASHQGPFLLENGIVQVSKQLTIEELAHYYGNVKVL